MTFPRSILFVPANRTAMFAHAWASEAEAVIFDLEDSVPAAQKAAAREAVASLRPPEGWTRPIYVRLNAAATSDFASDVHAVRTAPVQAVVLPKIEDAADVKTAAQAVPTSLGLILLIETPGGVLRLAELMLNRVPRVAALAFGAEDYRAGIGVTELDPALADFARASVVNAAAAAGVPAIDAPYLRLDDLERLRTASRHARSLGFKSKFAIHPSQVPIIHEEFAGKEDREWATRVTEAYERAKGEGKGSVALDGRMIDEATVKRARDILQA